MTTHQSPASAALAALDGLRMPYDCPDPNCDAEEVIKAQQGHPNLHAIEIQHDEGCRWLEERRRQQRRAATQQSWKRRSPKAAPKPEEDR